MTGQWGPRADVRQSSSQGSALVLEAKMAEAMITATGQWGLCADVRRSWRRGAALVVATKARDVVKVHHELAHPEEETWEVPSDPEEKTRDVPLDPEEETREVPLDPEERIQEAPLDPAEETREAPSDREDEAQGTPSDPEEETLEAPSDPEEEILEGPSDTEETKYVAGLAERPTDLEGPVVPARRKLIISGNLPPNNVKVHVESAGARRRGRSCTAKFSADGRRR